jgi:hypothetical protein
MDSAANAPAMKLLFSAAAAGDPRSTFSRKRGGGAGVKHQLSASRPVGKLSFADSARRA